MTTTVDSDGGGYRGGATCKVRVLDEGEIEVEGDALLVIKLTDSWVLKIIARSFLLALVIVTLPLFEPIIRGSSVNTHRRMSHGSDGIDFPSLNSVFEDLANEGIFRNNDKALIMSHGMSVGVMPKFEAFNGNELDVVMDSDLEEDGYIADESVDFAFVLGTVNTKFVHRVMKTGGVLAFELRDYPSIDAFLGEFNYEIVYLKRLGSTVLALRKVSPRDGQANSATGRRLLALEYEAKKAAALKGLEDVWLEPPRRALAKKSKHVKNFKYLPDLLGDSLQAYKRRMFINVGSPKEQKASLKWFNQNYPTRNQDFSVHNLETATKGPSSTRKEVSDWLWENVKEEDYVVMKAEAQTVEKMLDRRTTNLVDEVFMECNNEWQERGAKRSKRAYWECLALYGRLRDKGVAVHQWWN